MKKNELGVPVPKRYGWLIVLGAFALLGTIGVILGLLYRDTPKRSDIIARDKTKNAKHVVFAIVLSTVEPALADTIVKAIKAEIGTDTAHTDYIIGSTVVDPWCASIDEYDRMLRRAMSETKHLDAGRQTTMVSMVTGLLVKSKLPASVFIIGTLHPREPNDFVRRTTETADAMEIRNSIMGPLRTIFYLRPASDKANVDYINIFAKHTFHVEIR